MDEQDGEERKTRPTEPPTLNDLIMALTETNTLIIGLQDTLRRVERDFGNHEDRLTLLELAAE